jgi:hypothetical protein
MFVRKKNQQQCGGAVKIFLYIAHDLNKRYMLSTCTIIIAVIIVIIKRY